MDRTFACPRPPYPLSDRVNPADDRARAVVPERLFPVTVFGINEPTPGPRWRSLFDATWPAYRAWYLGRGDAARPDLDTASAMLARHMPELVQTHENLVGLTGGDETAARMLTLWNAPAFLPGCAQAALTGPTPALCRNYDYSPDLWERTIYTSAFTGRRVIGSGDCLWGLLDGMNDAGLVVSLTFGGAPGRVRDSRSRWWCATCSRWPETCERPENCCRACRSRCPTT